MPAKRKKRTKPRPEKLWYAIYVVINRLSGEKYLGFTQCPKKDYVTALTIRFERHLKRAENYNDTLICQNIAKHGKDNFQIVLLEHVQGKQKTLDREKELIKNGDYALNMVHRVKRKTTNKTLLKKLGLPTDRIASHPGEIIEEFLPQYQITKENLARYLGYSSAETFDLLLKGDWDISVAQAIVLSKLFGNSVHFWLNLQYHHNLSKEIHNTIGDMSIFGNIPRLEPKNCE